MWFILFSGLLWIGTTTVRRNTKNVAYKGKEKVTEGPIRKRARNSQSPGSPDAQQNSTKKSKRVRCKWGSKWVNDYKWPWYASFKPYKYHAETLVDEEILRAHHSNILKQDFEESLDDYVPTPNPEPYVELASDGETKAATQESKYDSDTDHAPTGNEDEEYDDY
ncbi:hypothetical protein K7X08_032487 [Anisodus acutangulus]|uniref:Uncharacterized protein n=1 Tax=Anisodus acutangulus TaxID=402998 RepID=A0A9Q1LQ81_9SOLA|nr:hypothetical protein K7X08_032487 [Anisodus acutangulus]